MNCIYCNHHKLYILKTKQYKCAKCKKKFSIKKIKQKYEITKCFCNNLTINQTKNRLNLNYLTIKNQYESLRKYIAIYLENQYIQEQVKAYEEYVYIEKSKKNKSKYIFDAQNFLTFQYNDKIYNLLMPTLSRYKDQFLDDGLDEVYFKEFSKFMTYNKISKIKQDQTLIQQFWYFFEDEILKYKGVKTDNFFYYLKECEFKFNYTKKEQLDILLNKPN
jgi:transposase-like protein